MPLVGTKSIPAMANAMPEWMERYGLVIQFRVKNYESEADNRANPVCFQVFNFLNQKTEHSFLMRRNPRKICWTVLYRRKHKKGSHEEVVKKRTRRTHKFQRAIQGATLESILAKRNQKPEVRKAQREQLIRYVKSNAHPFLLFIYGIQ